MALATKRGSEVPEGALVLSETEALDYQKKLVEEWPRESEVFFLKYGSVVSFSTTLVSTFTIMDYFRRALNVHKKSYILFTAPPLLLPCYVSYMLTDRVVTNNTLLMTLKCPLCNQLKFTMGQAYAGVIFPTIYGVCSYTMIAYHKNFYKFKITLNDTRDLWKEMFKFVKGAKTVHLIGGLMQTALVFGLPYMQSLEFSRLMHNVREQSDNES